MSALKLVTALDTHKFTGDRSTTSGDAPNPGIGLGPVLRCNRCDSSHLASFLGIDGRSRLRCVICGNVGSPLVTEGSAVQAAV